MDDMNQNKAQSTTDYNSRTTRAVKSVIIEIFQILGSFRGKFVIIGGTVPWLLQDNIEMPHVGSIDVDLSLDAEALGEGEYASLIDELKKHSYSQDKDCKRFQLVRTVPATDGGHPIDIIIDFLMPRYAEITRNTPPLIDNFAVQRADGADLSLKYFQYMTLVGQMPDGSKNQVEVAICSIPAFIAMKGHALQGRLKHKDAYDIYYSIRNYMDGIEALAEACRPVLEHESGKKGYYQIKIKFDSPDAFGPASVRKFADTTGILGNRTAEQWQADAFGQVDAWLRALGLVKKSP